MVTTGAILAALGVLFFIPSLVLKHSLYKYVSREKVVAENDITQLWKHSIPPNRILSEKGKAINRYTNIGMGLSFAFLLLLMLYLAVFVLK
jgi:hypothetical protein